MTHIGSGLMLFTMAGWLTLIAINVAIDWWLIKTRRGVNHPIEVIIRAMVFIVYAGAVFGVNVPDFYAFKVFIFCSTSFIVFFEHALNLSRGLAWDYLSKSPDAPLWDKFWRERRQIYYMFKMFCLILMVTSIVWLVKGTQLW